MRIRNHRDFWAGVMFMAFGVGFVLFSTAYPLGTTAKMGPAFFPTVLGVLLAVLGAIISAGAFPQTAIEAQVAKFGWREIFLVLLGVALFAFMLPRLGLVVSVFTLIFVAASASHEFHWKESTISAIVLVLLAYGLFSKGLELQFPVWPKFLVQ